MAGKSWDFMVSFRLKIDCMLTSLIPEDELVTVAVAQTTFAVLTTPKARFRIDFIDKAEAYLKPGMRGNFKSYSEHHPLLLNYNSRLVEVYINSRPQDPEGLFAEIRERIESVFQSWRDWRCVLPGRKSAGEKQLKQNLLDGSGLLLPGAPIVVAQSIIEGCTKYGASTYVLGDIGNTLPIASPFYLLLVGEGYVIAKDFRITELSKEKPRLPGQSA
jgi:hypothetical protein